MIALSISLMFGVASVSRADTDEILDGPLEGLGATDEVFSPPGLTGDWGGRRTSLSEHGLAFSADITNTLQGVMDGGFDETARYVGSSELILDVDAEKLGLWPGGFARIATEGRFGKDVLVKAGSFSPVHNDALFPNGPPSSDGPSASPVGLVKSSPHRTWIPCWNSSAYPVRSACDRGCHGGGPPW
ncbi:MAG: hypothetical protein JRE45_20290 [Deltaproteobacteria bacterium]|nr:hypothetical protein [Deltaproteobacteria bacterium]